MLIFVTTANILHSQGSFLLKRSIRYLNYQVSIERRYSSFLAWSGGGRLMDALSYIRFHVQCARFPRFLFCITDIHTGCNAGRGGDGKSERLPRVASATGRLRSRQG